MNQSGCAKAIAIGCVLLVIALVMIAVSLDPL